MLKRHQGRKYLHAVTTFNHVAYLSGIGADDIAVGMTEQTRQICGKIDRLLASVGTDKSQLLTAQIFITDMAAKEAMNVAWLEWLTPEQLPCRNTIGIASLGEPNRLIEVVVTAAMPD